MCQLYGLYYFCFSAPGPQYHYDETDENLRSAVYMLHYTYIHTYTVDVGVQ